MVTRRVLAFDDDSAFINLLESSLGAYGFEVRTAQSGLDDIRMAEVFDPDAIFIAVDAPDTIGYTLFNKARVVVGKKARIILVTATLPPEDFASHEKLALHADLYLDKRELSSDDLLRKLDGLLGLGPRPGPPVSDNENFEQIFGDDEFASPEVFDVEIHDREPIGSRNRQGRIGGAPVPVAGRRDELRGDKDDTGGDVSRHAGSIGEQIQVKDARDYADLNRRLTDQQSELFRLRRQLEEARRDARSSPFSSDFLKLRERVVQKDLEITLLTEKLHDINSEVHAGKSDVEELKKTVIGLSTEIGQGLTREQDLTDRLRHKQEEIATLIDQHAAAMEQAEVELQSALESARALAEQELTKVKESHQQALHTLEANHVAQLAQFHSEGDARIQKLEEKTSEEYLQTANRLAREQQAHQQTREEYEDRLAQLQSEQSAKIETFRQKATKEQQQTKDALAQEQRAHRQTREAYEARLVQLQSGKDGEIEALRQKAIRDQQQAADALTQEHQAHQQTRREYEARFAQLHSERAEIEVFKQQAATERQQTADALAQEQRAHQQTRQQHEAQLAQLQGEHDADMKLVEQERNSALESARELAEEALTKAKEKHQHALETLEKKYTSQIAQLQSERDAEVEILQQRVAEMEQRTADELAQSKQVHQQTHAQFEAKIADLQNQHAAVLKKVELERDSAFETARELVENELTKAVENQRYALGNLEANYVAKLAQLRSEKDAEIEILKQKATEEQHTAHMLVRERNAHHQTREQSDARIAQLEDKHAAAMERAEVEKRSELALAQKLAKGVLADTEEKYQRVIRALEANSSGQLARLQAEKEALEKKVRDVHQTADLLAQEKLAHEQTRQRSEAQVAQLQAVIKESKKEWQDLLRSAQEKHKVELQKAEERRQQDLLNLESAILTTEMTRSGKQLAPNAEGSTTS